MGRDCRGRRAVDVRILVGVVGDTVRRLLGHARTGFLRTGFLRTGFLRGLHYYERRSLQGCVFE